MTFHRTAQEYIDGLQLEPLPAESGYFGGLYISGREVISAGSPSKACSSIYYLLTQELPTNYLHRLQSDDVHVLIDGGPIDYFIFHPDGSAQRKTLGRNLEAGERPMIAVPAGCWKSLKLHSTASFGLTANVLSPGWAPENVQIGAGRDFVDQFLHRAPWATEDFLYELIGPNRIRE